MLYTLRFFFSLQNAVCFIMLTSLVPVLFTFYTKGVLKLKKENISGAKGLRNKILIKLFALICVLIYRVYVKNQSHYRPGVAQSVPGS